VFFKSSLLVSYFIFRYRNVVFEDVNGKTLHVVERMPPSVTATAASSQSASESESASSGGRRQQPREGFYRAGEPGIIFGTVSLPLPTGGMNAEQMQVGCFTAAP
jgi:hypothetical protein